jgi:hypothetical protein
LTPFVELVASPWLGSLVGIRHALEPDHLAAVTTLITHEPSGRRAVLLGACWGVGHTLSLIAAGTVLIGLRAGMPASAAAGFELLVAVMLIVLGVRAVSRACREGSRGPTRLHRHGRLVHTHAGVPAHLHLAGWTIARRPLLVGAVHGLAGSGTLAALVLTALPSTAARITYLVLFGVGSTLGMAALSGLLGWPLARLSQHRLLARTVSLLVGCGSTLVGLWWGYPLIGALAAW